MSIWIRRRVYGSSASLQPNLPVGIGKQISPINEEPNLVNLCAATAAT
jgi:hypothetical protein